jgi:two-component system chemotaxis sensor kinase CheA
VRANVQKISGTIDVQSARGKGTTLRIKIPLTLAIIPALIVTSGGDRYAIPQVSVHELVRLGGGGMGIEDLHGAPVYRLRDSLLPLVHLSRVLRAEAATGNHLVVVQTQGCTFGLVVDEVNDTEEIVVKPLDRQMQQVGPYAGATILGDGRVALILDARAIAHEARLLIEGRPRPKMAARAADAERADVEPLLVARVGADGRVALPLSQVARLEEFDAARVEKSGQREVIQYRGRILPLVRVGELIGAYGGDEAPATLRVVVHTTADGDSVGLVVERILDVVRQPLVRAAAPARSAGVLGAVVIQERVTELLDLDGLVRSAGVLA